jgi:protein O-mannosyl-transferase
MLVFLYLRLFDSTGERRWHQWAALFAATLYCVHTGNTQPGNYISARSELLSALGVVGGFIVYLYAPRTRRYYLYLVPVIVGTLAKNHAVTFAPLLFAYKLFVEERLSLREILAPRNWRRVARPFVATLPAFILSAAMFRFVEGMNPPGQWYGGGGRLPYLVTEAWVWVRYVGMYFLPVQLTADTDLFPFTTLTNPRTYAGVALLIASLAVVWRASRTANGRPIAFGIAWFWLTVAPTSSIFPLAEVMNDHRPFLPFIGLNAAVVWAAWLVAHRIRERAAMPARRTRMLAGAGIVVLLIHAVSTFQRNKVWRTDEGLWADVVRKSPNNGRGLMNYGLAHMKRGDLAGARDLFLRAQQRLPVYSLLEINLGIVTNALGDPAAAEAHFLRAAALDPNQPKVHFFYARFLIDRGRGPEAISYLERVIPLSPGNLEARHTLMALYAARGAQAPLVRLSRETLNFVSTDDVSRAYVNGQMPLKPDRDDYTGWYALGLSRTQTQQHLEAALGYRVAVARNPANADALNNLGWTLGKLGFFAEAVPVLQRAVASAPGNQLARNNLAWVTSQASQAPRG